MTKKRKKPGPPKTKGKDPMHSFRVPDKEWSKWQAVASEADKSLSSWLRELANNASRAG